MLKRLIRPLLFAVLLLAAACQGDPLLYREGTPGDLADRIERFAEALDTRYETEGIESEEASRCMETFTQYADEARACCGELTIDDAQRIAASLGRISGVVLKGSAGKIHSLIKGGAEMLPGFFNELKSSLSDSEELQELQEMLQQKTEELQ